MDSFLDCFQKFVFGLVPEVCTQLGSDAKFDAILSGLSCGVTGISDCETIPRDICCTLGKALPPPPLELLIMLYSAAFKCLILIIFYRSTASLANS